MQPCRFGPDLESTRTMLLLLAAALAAATAAAAAVCCVCCRCLLRLIPWAGRYAGRRGQSPAFAQAGLLKLQVSGQYRPSSESLAQAGFPSSESGKAQYRDGGCRLRRAATAAGETLCPPPCWPPLGGIAQPSHLISLRPDPSESSILSPHHL